MILFSMIFVLLIAWSRHIFINIFLSSPYYCLICINVIKWRGEIPAISMLLRAFPSTSDPTVCAFDLRLVRLHLYILAVRAAFPSGLLNSNLLRRQHYHKSWIHHYTFVNFAGSDETNLIAVVRLAIHQRKKTHRSLHEDFRVFLYENDDCSHTLLAV